MSTNMESNPTPITMGSSGPLLTMTDAAIEKVKYFAGTMPDSQNKPLRIFVQGGGCSGFQYGFTLTRRRKTTRPSAPAASSRVDPRARPP